MPLAGLETTIPASELLQTHALDSADTGIGQLLKIISNIYRKLKIATFRDFLGFF
jgi:hypothetical protein